MKVAVVTVWAPRKADEHWRDDYLELLRLQRKTALRFGHLHMVVTDGELGREFNTLGTALPANVMRAQLAGQIAWLERPVVDDLATLFVDADCLIARELSGAFAPDFDLGLTPREHPTAPINNGAMYVPAGGRNAALWFLRAALERCGEHWGADQEAISACAAPVLEAGGRAERCGARIAYLPMRFFNVIPKAEGARHKADPFVVHFKGETKAWAATYARLWIL